MSDSASPLVSLIVRSSARPRCRRHSIRSPCRITRVWRSSSSPPAAAIIRRFPIAPAHPLRLVNSDVRLSRPQAANAGLDAARGDWITFLDDDDLLLSGHVAGTRGRPSATRRRRAIGLHAGTGPIRRRPHRILGQAIRAVRALRAQLHPLVDGAVRAEPGRPDGCRFDEAFEIMQDWDFFLQCAQQTPFHFEPRQTFEWRVDLGTSGTGVGDNKDAARFARFRDAIYAKWGGRASSAGRAGQAIARGRDGKPPGSRLRRRRSPLPGGAGGESRRSVGVQYTGVGLSFDRPAVRRRGGPGVRGRRAAEQSVAAIQSRRNPSRTRRSCAGSRLPAARARARAGLRLRADDAGGTGPASRMTAVGEGARACRLDALLRLNYNRRLPIV